jgi:ADP-ribosylglycohydrolase
MLAMSAPPGPRAPASGSLYGLAFGDALAAPTEFLTVAEITARYGPAGPAAPAGDPARVTDDTQMALAVADALLDVGVGAPLTAAALEPRLRERFVAWSVSPDNDRAPGATCLRACAGLRAGRPWVEATQHASKGCGANMRVTPVGLVPGLSDDEFAGAAQLQAALTHGHPTALAASELTAYAVRALRAGVSPAELPAALRERSHGQRGTYRADWLGDLWRWAGAADPARFAAQGWDECLAVLDRLDAALALGDRTGDPCRHTGEGWIAEEALATGLLCFLLFPDEPVAGLRRAAVTAGDSDSIACLAGAFAGAAHGAAAWPPEWAQRIEYRAELARVAAAWDG